MTMYYMYVSCHSACVCNIQIKSDQSQCTCVLCTHHVNITDVFHPLQYGITPLHYAARGGHTTCVEHLLSTPDIDVDTAFQTIF